MQNKTAAKIARRRDQRRADRRRAIAHYKHHGGSLPRDHLWALRQMADRTIDRYDRWYWRAWFWLRRKLPL